MRISKQNSAIALAVLALVLLSWKSLVSYMNLSFSISNAWLLLLPFTIYISDRSKRSSVYFIPAILSLVLHALLPSPFFVLTAVSFSIFWLMEEFVGKLNKLAPLVIIIITPLSEYFFSVFGFPIRLKLTEIAAKMLQGANMNIEWQGNQIALENDIFSVDPECMGLSMVITSFLMALFMISSLEQKFKKQLSLFAGFLYLLLTSLVIITTNLIRIVMLILFRSAPDSFSHQFIGMMCLLLVTALPLFVVAYFLVKQSKDKAEREAIEKKPTKKLYFFYSLLIVGLLFSQFQTKDYIDIPQDKVANGIQIKGYEKEVLKNNIVKLYNEEAIIYIKPSKGIFRSNHNPKVCWKGSGYVFKKEKPEEIGNQSIYRAELHLDDEVMYTAWWYDNGNMKTNSQLDWRWESIQGQGNFRMINVTCNSEEELSKVTQQLLSMNLFKESE